MPFTTKIQSLVGAHSGIYGPAIDWTNNLFFEPGGSYLTRYGLITGLEEAFADQAALGMPATYSLALTSDGSIIGAGPGAAFNGGIQTIDPATLTSTSAHAFTGGHYASHFAGVLVGSQQYCIGNGPGGAIGGTKAIIICQDTTQIYADSWPAYSTSGSDFTGNLCAGKQGANTVYMFISPNPGGVTPQKVGIYEYTCSGSPSKRTLVEFIPADIDAAWTEIYFGGACIDQTDGNLLMFLSGQSGATTINYLLKVSVTDGSIVWQSAAVGTTARNLGAMQESSITHSRFGYVATDATPTIVIVNTTDGSTVSTQTTGLNGLNLVLDNGAYNDTAGCIVSWFGYNYTDADSPIQLNSTPSSFNGYGVLYIAAPYSVPSARRFLAVMGPIRDIQIGPPVPPGQPTNSVGTVGLDVAVAGVGVAGSIGTIALNMDVAGVGFGGDGVSTGTIGLDMAVSGVGFGGVVGGLITTMTLQNTGASAQAANFITPIFGHPFVQGQIPSGTAPIFQLPSGTNVPFSMSTVPSYWPDGSLKHASFMLRVPASIPAGSFLTVKILSGGSVPANSSRTTADYTAGGLDLNVSMTGMDNLSGTWTTNLGQGITAAHGDSYKFMDGQAGRVDCIRASGRQSGSDHGYLEGYWDVVATQDASGNLGGIRHLCTLTQPWDATGLGPSGANINWMSFSALTLNNGASVLVDMWPAARKNVMNFSWSSGVSWNVSNGNNQIGACLRFTSTGALPTGLNAGISYFYAGGNSSVCFLSIYSNFSSSYITGTNNGSGTHTMTAYPYLPPFTSSVTTATSAGKYNYTQGAGSIATDSTVRVVFDKYYIRQTKMVPSYALRQVNPTSYATTSYVVNGAGPVGRDPEMTGAAPNIGYLPRYQSTHLFTQAEVDELNVRVSGLTAGLYSFNYRRKASNGTIICVNNGHANSGVAYSGMMTPNPNYSAFISGTDPNVDTVGVGDDVSHGPNLPFYPFMITGEPQFQRLMAQWATTQMGQHQKAPSSMVISTSAYTLADGGGRNITQGGTTYYGANFGTSSTRYDAWMLRNIMCAAAFSYPESASYNTYFNDLVSATADMAVRAISLAPTAYLIANKLWLTNQTYYIQSWQHGYTMMSMINGYNMLQNTNLQTAVQALVTWWNHVVNVKTAWNTVGGAQLVIRPNLTYQGPLLTNDLYLCSIGPSMLWTNGSANFTLSPGGSDPTGAYVPAVGDLVMWTESGPAVNTYPIPTAFTSYVPYYILTKSGSGPTYTVTLTATQSTAFGGPGGGSAVVNIDSDPGYAIQLYLQPGTPPTTGAYSLANDPGGFLANHRGCLNQAVASGLTVSPSAQADVNSRWTGSFVPDVTWAMTNSYNYTA